MLPLFAVVGKRLSIKQDVLINSPQAARGKPAPARNDFMVSIKVRISRSATPLLAEEWALSVFCTCSNFAKKFLEISTSIFFGVIHANTIDFSVMT